MQGNDLTLETASGVYTRSLVTAILESRRAYQLAMALAKQVLLSGQDLQWEAASEASELQPEPSRLRSAAPARSGDLRFSMRRRSPRHGLRLVLPNRFDSPLVMPADSEYSSAKEPRDQQPDDRRKLDADPGNSPRDGKADE